PQTFIFLGRFTKVKGVATLLRAWLQLPEAASERRLVLIGAGKDLEKEIAGLLEKAARRSDVQNLGVLDVSVIRQRLEAAHCIVVPSEWVEIGPLVLHEALACGANVLVSNVGGNKELAEFYGEGCQTFRMGDAGDLAQKIRDFQFSPMQKKVRKQVEHYALVLEKYQGLLAPASVEALPELAGG
ncbi:MAG: glycosyltransferase, partial [Bacteroidota bacterium]